MKNNLYKAALLAALGLGGVTATQAQINNNDLVLGFTSPNATSISGTKYDYLIDLGNLSTIEAGGASQLTLSGSQFDSATFNSILGSAVTGGSAYVGIVGGTSGSSGDVFYSNASQPVTGTHGNYATAAGVVPGLTLGQVPQTGQSFYNWVAESPSSQGAMGNSSFSGYVGNPLYAVSASQGSGSQNIDLTLWEGTYTSIPSHASAFSNIGFISLNLTGGNLGVAWNQEAVPAAVPEPTVLALLGGAGLLLLGFRRQSIGKNA